MRCRLLGGGFGSGAPIDARIDESSRGFRAARYGRLGSICEITAKNCLLRLFRPLPLAEADTRTAAVFVDKVHAGHLKCISNNFQSGSPGLSGCSFKLVDGDHADARLLLDEAAVPSIYWEPSEPRLNRLELLNELKGGADIKGVTLSNPEPVLSVRTK